ncbi:MAG TPA: hypothetical protein PLX95_03470 [bacterium]|nr:hypothetical protein [bacterium]
MENCTVICGFDSEDSAQDAISLCNKHINDCWIEDGDYEIKKVVTNVGTLYVPNIFDVRQRVPFWHFAYHNDFVQDLIKEGREVCH